MGDSLIQSTARWNFGAQGSLQQCGSSFTPLVENLETGEMISTDDCRLFGGGLFVGGRLGLAGENGNFFIGPELTLDGILSGNQMDYTSQAQAWSTMPYVGVAAGLRMDIWRFDLGYLFAGRRNFGATPYAYTEGDRLLAMPGTTDWTGWGAGNMIKAGYTAPNGLVVEGLYGQLQNWGTGPDGEARTAGDFANLWRGNFFNLEEPGQFLLRIGYEPLVKEKENKKAWYVDSDKDGYGAQGSEPKMSRKQPADYVSNNTDCNDDCAACYPGATETVEQAGDRLDQDCNGSDAQAKTFYRDADGDGWGVVGDTKAEFTVPTGYTAKPGDCDDANSTVHPGATEVPNDGIDQDCKEGDLVSVRWYEDKDKDGYGSADPNAAINVTDGHDPNTTEGVTIAYVQNNTDCNDDCADCHPGGTEVADNDLDEDCDGTVDRTRTAVVTTRTTSTVRERLVDFSRQIQFKQAKSVLLEHSKRRLDEVAQLLNEHSEIKLVSIDGHTSSEGSDTSNQTLSENRANAVRDYLISKGVDGSRLQAVGYGETRLLNPDVENGALVNELAVLNRRVELNIVQESSSTE